MTTELTVTTDAHFAWMLGEAPPPDGLRLPPGGAEDPAVLRWMRRKLPRIAGRGWMMVADGEVVGLCGHKGPPNDAAEAEIGYGVAATRRRLGHATRAVALIVAASRRDPQITALTAETALANLASQRVLEANGFMQMGEGYDDDEGETIVWRLATPAVGESR